MNGCKQCPAYAKCTVTYRGSACAALRSTYELDNDPEIVTNADYIRSLDDEGLARILFEFAETPLEEDYLSWLRKPREEYRE